MQIELSTDQELLNDFFANEQLAHLSLPDCDIQPALDKTLDLFKEHSNYLVIQESDEVLAVIKFESLTEITAICHLYISPKEWGQKRSYQFIPLVEDWFKENTQVHKLVVQTPESCTHVQMTAAKNGFWIEGVLTGAIYWRGNIEALIILSKFIERKHG